MTAERLDSLLSDALNAYEVPDFPAQHIAARLAEPAHGAPRPRPVRAITVGALVLCAALAVGVPTSSTMTAAAKRTWERLLGHPIAQMSSRTLPKMSLREALKHTAFPVVVPRGIQVVDATPFPDDEGIGLTVTVDGRAQGELAERWAESSKPGFDGIGVHDDGSIRRFNVRRWRVGRVAFSFVMFDPSYQGFADAVERGTKPEP